MPSDGGPFLPWPEFRGALNQAENHPALLRIVGALHSHWLRDLEAQDIPPARRWLARQSLKRVLRRRRLPDSAEPRICFYVDGDHPGLANLLPIIEAVDRRAIPTDIILLDYFLRSERHRFAHLRHARLISFDAILGLVGFGGISSGYRQAVRHQHEIERDVGEGPLRDALVRHPNFTRTRLAELAVWEAAMGRYFDRHPCRAFVALGFTNGLALAAKLASSGRDVKTVLPVHGAIYTMDPTLVPPYHSDMYLAWGPWWDAAFAEARAAGSEVVHVGYPRYDGIRSRSLKTDVPDRIPQLRGHHPVVYLTDNSLFFHAGQSKADEFYRQSAELLRSIVQEGNLVFKLHPGIDPESRIVKATWPRDLLDHCAFVQNDYSLLDLLPHAGVVVGGATTGLLEAMLFDVPVIQLKTLDFGLYDLSRANCLRVALEALPDAIHRLRTDERFRADVIRRQRTFLGRALVHLDASADQAAAALARLMANPSSPVDLPPNATLPGSATPADPETSRFPA